MSRVENLRRGGGGTFEETMCLRAEKVGRIPVVYSKTMLLNKPLVISIMTENVIHQNGDLLGLCWKTDNAIYRRLQTDFISLVSSSNVSIHRSSRFKFNWLIKTFKCFNIQYDICKWSDIIFITVHVIEIVRHVTMAGSDVLEREKERKNGFSSLEWISSSIQLNFIPKCAAKWILDPSWHSISTNLLKWRLYWNEIDYLPNDFDIISSFNLKAECF